MEKQPRLTSRQIQAQKTKRRIFNAAFDLLQEMDIDEIKIADIVKASGVCVGTFYHYYKTKWDVFYESFQLLDDYYEEKVTPNLTQPHIKDRLLYFFTQYIIYHGDEHAANYLRTIFSTTNPVFMRSLYADYGYGMLCILRETLQQAITDGQIITDESVVDIAAFFMMSFRGLIFDWCARDGSYDIYAALDYHISHLLRIYQN